MKKYSENNGWHKKRNTLEKRNFLIEHGWYNINNNNNLWKHDDFDYWYWSGDSTDVAYERLINKLDNDSFNNNEVTIIYE